MDIVSALGAASDEFDRRLHLVNAADWERATPCSEWDVGDLVGHVVGGNRFAIAVLAGEGVDGAMARVMAASADEDPLDAWAASSDEQMCAFAAAGALDRRVDHPLGAMSGREFLGLRVFDITVHAWDLAVALGADERLHPDLVDVVLSVVRSRPEGMGFGVSPVTGETSDAAQTSLLRLAGR